MNRFERLVFVYGLVALALAAAQPAAGAVFQSLDGGRHWTAFGPEDASAIAFTPDNAAYVATFEGEILAHPRGSGEWIQFLEKSHDYDTSFIDVLAVSTQNGRILIHGAYSGEHQGLWYYDLLVGSWTKLLNGFVADGGSLSTDRKQIFVKLYDKAVRVPFDTLDPVWLNSQEAIPFNINAKHIYDSGFELRRSDNQGKTWISLNSPLPRRRYTSPWKIAVDPRNEAICYAYSDQGVFLSTNAGDTWTSIYVGNDKVPYGPRAPSSIAFDPKIPGEGYITVRPSSIYRFSKQGRVVKRWSELPLQHEHVEKIVFHPTLQQIYAVTKPWLDAPPNRKGLP